jgi:hypothetical protein
MGERVMAEEAYKLGVIRRVTLEERHEITVNGKSALNAARKLAQLVKAGHFFAGGDVGGQEVIETAITIGTWHDGEWQELLKVAADGVPH